MPHARGGLRGINVGDIVFVKGRVDSTGWSSWTGTVRQVFPDLCACVVEGSHEEPELVLTSRLVQMQVADVTH